MGIVFAYRALVASLTSLPVTDFFDRPSDPRGDDLREAGADGCHVDPRLWEQEVRS